MLNLLIIEELVERTTSREQAKEGGSKHQKNNTRDSNVVPHRSTNLARRCLTSLSRREAVLSSWYGRSCHKQQILNIYTTHIMRAATTLDILSDHTPHYLLLLSIKLSTKPKLPSYTATSPTTCAPEESQKLGCFYCLV